jgi:hypothetical protein
MKKKKKKNLPFAKGAHVNLIKPIAIGLKQAGFLNRYLEIGIRSGPCFNAVAPLATESYAVDIDKRCYNNIKHNKNLIWFCGKSTDFLRQHNSKKKFDLVFIDGAHEYKASLGDFEQVLPLVNENGIILLHDTYPPEERFLSKSYCNDTYKTAEHIKRNYTQYELVTLPFYYGISIVRKIERQLLWRK